MSKPEHRCSHIADIALCRIPRYSDQAARRLTSRQPHGGVTTIGRTGLSPRPVAHQSVRTFCTPSRRPAKWAARTRPGNRRLYARPGAPPAARNQQAGTTKPSAPALADARRNRPGSRPQGTPARSTQRGHRTRGRPRVQSVASGSGPSPIEDPPAGARRLCRCEPAESISPDTEMPRRSFALVRQP